MTYLYKYREAVQKFDTKDTKRTILASLLAGRLRDEICTVKLHSRLTVSPNVFDSPKKVVTVCSDMAELHGEEWANRSQLPNVRMKRSTRWP